MGMIEKSVRKSLKIKPSGRSSDFITPSFGHGCLYKCHYCYMRRNKPDGLNIALNTGKILQSISQHIEKQEWPKEPNQTHDTLYTYDFSCNEDFILHLKHHKWKKIFKYFVKHPKIMGTAATKYVNEKLLTFNPKGKIRIRMSLMPQVLSNRLEPNTSKILDRIWFINDLINAGYDVHVNISPVVVTRNFEELYGDLLYLLDSNVYEEFKDSVKAEVIFLTHSSKMHRYNMCHGNRASERILHVPLIQQKKISEHGGHNLRYSDKKYYIEDFKNLVDRYCDWLQIRYIF